MTQPVILLTGRSGQVGWELERTLQPLGKVVACDRQALDLANPDSIRAVIRDLRPALIVNAAAYTAVDRAETEPELALAINGAAPGILAEEAKRLGAALIHYSTDYVFDGTRREPYGEDDAPNPINVYGKTKLAGEQAIRAVGAPHWIFRTSWVYGLRGKNFLLTIRRLAQDRSELRVVDDQFGAPTWSRMIAEATAQALAKSAGPRAEFAPALAALGGVYHLTASGRTTWCGFARAIVELLGAAGESKCSTVAAISTSDYPLPARRPANSSLATRKLAADLGINACDWRAALGLCLGELR